MGDDLEARAERWFEEHSEDSPSAVIKALAALLRAVRYEALAEADRIARQSYRPSACIAALRAGTPHDSWCCARGSR